MGVGAANKLSFNDCVVLSAESTSTSELVVSYDSDYPIAGYEFNYAGLTLTGESSPVLNVSFDSIQVIGYLDFFSGATLPAGTGVLATLTFAESAGGYDFTMSNLVLSASDGMTEYASSDPGVTTIAACSDSDGDSVCDSADLCDGFNDLQDVDADSTPDCLDGCVNDPNKTEAGQCGCGNADTDSDGDLTADCNDVCVNDPKKITEEGPCGCGVADTDCAYLTLGDVVELPSECSYVCQSTTTGTSACTFADPDPNYTFVEVCSSPGYGLPVNYYAGQDVTGFQFNVSNLNITGATGGATDGMEIFFSDNGNVAGIINSSSGAGTAAAGTGVLTTLVFTDATDASSVLSMDSSDAIAGPISGSDSQAFVFQAPSNQAQASGSVSHCGENGVSNSSAHWSLDTCSVDCSGSYYAGSLVDQCSVCDSDTANDCTQDCNGAWGGPDNIKDNGDEAYNDHCNVCDDDPINDCVVLLSLIHI